MGKYRQKKQVVKEAFTITRIIIASPQQQCEVELENGEVLFINANEPVFVGDFVVTQSATDRYHCPMAAFLEGYEAVTTTVLNPENTTTK